MWMEEKQENHHIFFRVTYCLAGFGFGTKQHHLHPAVSFIRLCDCMLHKLSCWMWQHFHSTVRRQQEAWSHCSFISITGIHFYMDSALLRLFQRDWLCAVSLRAVFSGRDPTGMEQTWKEAINFIVLCQYYCRKSVISKIMLSHTDDYQLHGLMLFF